MGISKKNFNTPGLEVWGDLGPGIEAVARGVENGMRLWVGLRWGKTLEGLAVITAPPNFWLETWIES